MRWRRPGADRFVARMSDPRAPDHATHDMAKVIRSWLLTISACYGETVAGSPTLLRTPSQRMSQCRLESTRPAEVRSRGHSAADRLSHMSGSAWRPEPSLIHRTGILKRALAMIA